MSFKDRLQTAITNAPGTSGNFSIGSAIANYQTFGLADNGLLFDILIISPDQTKWEICQDCTYTHSTKTLTRGTFLTSSTGSAIAWDASAIVAQTLTAERMGVVDLNHTIGAINRLKISDSTAGNGVLIETKGTDNRVDMNFVTKNQGNYNFGFNVYSGSDNYNNYNLGVNNGYFGSGNNNNVIIGVSNGLGKFSGISTPLGSAAYNSIIGSGSILGYSTNFNIVIGQVIIEDNNFSNIVIGLSNYIAYDVLRLGASGNIIIGTSCFVTGSENNILGGLNSQISGSDNTVINSGSGAFAMNYTLSINGGQSAANYCISIGAGAYPITTHQYSYSPVSQANLGDTQKSDFILYGTTVGAVTVNLTIDGTDEIIVPLNGIMAFTGQVIARKYPLSSAKDNIWNISGAIKNVAGTAAIIGTPVVTSIASEGAPTWTMAFTNNTNMLRLNVNGTVALEEVNWMATIITTELNYR